MPNYRIIRLPRSVAPTARTQSVGYSGPPARTQSVGYSGPPALTWDHTMVDLKVLRAHDVADVKRMIAEDVRPKLGDRLLIIPADSIVEVTIKAVAK